MLCKVCGRTLTRRVAVRCRVEPAQGVLELLCWTCRYWLHTGEVYEVRR